MTIAASTGLSGVLLVWSVLLALHPTEWSSPKGAVLGLLAGLAASGAHRHAAAPVLTLSGLALLARPFVRPVQYFHLGRWHDLDLTSHTHYGMSTRGGLLLALAAVAAWVLVRGSSELRRHLRLPVVGIVCWSLYPLTGDGRDGHRGFVLRHLGDTWIVAWTAIAAVATVVVVVAVIVDEVRARRNDVTLVRGSLFLP